MIYNTRHTHIILFPIIFSIFEVRHIKFSQTSSCSGKVQCYISVSKLTLPRREGDNLMGLCFRVGRGRRGIVWRGPLDVKTQEKKII